ncbi:heavy metal-associated isoprenylated plant protein 20-like [Thalictrum thalictroides]|uniref:Heavy metal-associated isoprenylated plant protein 20-like n=1 Tax=Thalictrum thalictroides TaxID=46969 RepID=A0A7J6WUZ0_THATH|nr:heavy metal-associated isoprenylated plant protein 20-like [Thalictrum thalictroides]
MAPSKESSSKKLKTVVVEYKISMYCKACEKTIAQVISKFKGVETFTTDMIKHRVTVKGRILPEKLLKKLKKKTGKKVEIVVPNDASKSNAGDNNDKKDSAPMMFDDWGESSLFTMFSDENPNACSVM